MRPVHGASHRLPSAMELIGQVKVEAIVQKLEVRDRTQAVILAMQMGLVSSY